MKSYQVSYYYLATGMEGKADTHPTELILAEDRDHAAHQYMTTYFYPGETFERFMSRSPAERTWGLTIKESSGVTIDDHTPDDLELQYLRDFIKHKGLEKQFEDYKNVRTWID